MAASPPLLAVVIPVYDQWGFTRDCLTSLAEHLGPLAPRVAVRLVDNGSTDETVTELEPLGSALFGERFTRIRNEENRNFGPACNQGAAAGTELGAPYLLFLNNDTLTTSGWLPPLLAAFQEVPDLGACSPLLLFPDTRRVQHCGIAFSPTLATEHLYSQFPPEHPAVRRPRDVAALTGAAFLVPTALFQEIGGFHEGYVNGSEDMELSCRLRRLGKRLRSIPQSVVLHATSQSEGRFDADDANAELLRARCSGCFRPDLHRHGAEDGYVLKLNPCLTSYLALPAAREAELAARLPATSEIGAIWTLLNEEPLFEPGYAPLANALSQAGEHVDACFVRFLAASFFPLPVHYKGLADAAKHAGKPQLMVQALEKLARLTSMMEDGEGLALRAERMHAWAQKAGELELAALYAAWQSAVN